jgi:hypothetical protein
MLTIEKEMISLLVKGASTQVENIQVSFFLVAWSTLLLAVLRMVRNEKEKGSFIRAKDLKSLAQDYARRSETETGSPPTGAGSAEKRRI